MALLRRSMYLYAKSSAMCQSVRKESSQPNWPSSSGLTIYQQKSVEFLKANQRKSMDYLKTKATHAYSWYEEFSGIRELKEAQNRVLLATTLLKDAQERRRAAKSPLSAVQKKLQDFQPELRNTPRDDDRYIQLVNEEHSLLKEIKFLQLELQEAENDEREAFEQLSTSLRTSHEAERVQAEKTKYFSIVASILGTVIGVFGSSINNSYRMKELKALVKESSNSAQLETAVADLQSLAAKIAAVDNISEIQDRINQTLAESKVVEANLERICRNMEDILKDQNAVGNTSLLYDKNAFTSERIPGRTNSFGGGLSNWLGGGNSENNMSSLEEKHNDFNKKLLLPIGAFMVFFVCVNELFH